MVKELPSLLKSWLPRLAVDVLENLGIHPGAQDIPDLAANDRIGAPMVENAPVHLCCH